MSHTHTHTPAFHQGLEQRYFSVTDNSCIEPERQQSSLISDPKLPATQALSVKPLSGNMSSQSFFFCCLFVCLFFSNKKLPNVIPGNLAHLRATPELSSSSRCTDITDISQIGLGFYFLFPPAFKYHSLQMGSDVYIYIYY